MYLRERLIQSGTISREDPFALDDLKEKLYARFHMIDYENAKADVINFIEDPHALDVWSDDFFCQITDHLHRTDHCRNQRIEVPVVSGSKLWQNELLGT